MDVNKGGAGSVLFTVLVCTAAFGQETTSLPACRVVEIGRGHSWVSPYWGYNTPKIVSDGTCYYTEGLWGMVPDQAEGRLYKWDGTAWHAGAHLPDIYQPATLLLDSEKRLIVIHTRKERPAVFLRAREPRTADHFEALPAPPDMVNAYYVGAAIRTNTLYFAYLMTPSYTMYLAKLDLNSLKWTPSSVVCEGQVAHKPKTAWTYSILVPTDAGLHFVASNCPDGGEGNTYNQVWYLFYPAGAMQPTVREMVAECPMGHFAYGTDIVVDASGLVHVSYLWNKRVYGEGMPPGSPAEGTYHAWRAPDAGGWRREYLGPTAITGFFVWQDGLLVIVPRNRTLVPLKWVGGEAGWKELTPLCDAKQIPAGPSFMDVISTSSGSDTHAGIALVTDGLLPGSEGESPERVLWSLLPADSIRAGGK